MRLPHFFQIINQIDLKRATFKKLDESKKEILIELMIQYFEEVAPEKVTLTKAGKYLDYPYLDQYWTDKNRSIFEITVDEDMIGFAMVNDWVIYKKYNANRSIAEFYIHPEWRRKSIGSEIAVALFSRFKGKWEIRQSADNKVAIKFWRRTIEQFTK